MIRERVTLVRGISSALLIVENRTDIVCRCPHRAQASFSFWLTRGISIERYPILDVLSL